VCFDDHLNLCVDDRKVELLFVGPAHTTNDVVFSFRSSVLFAGDLVFNGRTPFVVMAPSQVARRARAIRRLGAGLVVPGHGSVCGIDAIDDQVAYLRFVRSPPRVRRRHAPLELALATDLRRFAGLHDPERLVSSLYRAYRAARRSAQGSRSMCRRMPT
jgi:cyclase